MQIATICWRPAQAPARAESKPADLCGRGAPTGGCRSKCERKELQAVPHAVPRTGEDLARAGRAAKAVRVSAPFRQEPRLIAQPKRTAVGRMGRGISTTLNSAGL
jgi:hypothetical protein